MSSVLVLPASSVPRSVVVGSWADAHITSFALRGTKLTRQSFAVTHNTESL
jgi:hypothetical protein